MPVDFTPTGIQASFDKAMTAMTQACEVQVRFVEDSIKRYSAAIADLTETSVAGLQQFSSARNFTEAFESSIAQNDLIREKLQALVEDNTAAFEDFKSEAGEFYAVDGAVVAKAQELAENYLAVVRKVTEPLFPGAVTPALAVPALSAPVAETKTTESAPKKKTTARPARKATPRKAPAKEQTTG